MIEKMLNHISTNYSFFLKNIKLIWIILLTYYTNFKILDKKITVNFINILKFIAIIFFGIVVYYIQNNTSSFINIILIIIVLSALFSINNYIQSIITTVISLSTNYLMSLFSIVIDFFLVKKILKINNIFLNLVFILMIHITLLSSALKIKRLKYGIKPIKDYNNNYYSDMFIIEIGSILLLLFVFLNIVNFEVSKNVILSIIVYGIILCIIIEKAIRLQYKETNLLKELELLRYQVVEKDNNIQTLEQENLSYSKKAHSLEHKLKSLENKINKLTYNQEISKEIGIENEIKNISSQMHNKIVYVELDKTGIEEIDDMLDTMRNEAIKNNIEFNLQLKGNIYQMTNNYIDKQDLAILLADHIKDAIIAINHTENINKSILVRLGKIENCFALYIYDTGVEFKKEVLDNLGKIPITTYKEEGGTGMGFMNTFDTLNKTNASLTIKQIGPPSKDNYTKVIMITFDGKHEFKII